MLATALHRTRWLLWVGLLGASLAAQLLPKWEGLSAMAALRAVCEVAALVAIGHRWRTRPETSRLPWAGLFAGLSLLLLGDVFGALAFGGHVVLPASTSAVLVHLLPIPAFLLSLACWPAARPASPRAGAVLDGLLFGYASVFLIWSVGLHAWSADAAGPVAASLYARFVLLGVLLGVSVGMGALDERRWAGPLGYLGVAFGLWTLASALSTGTLLGDPNPLVRSASYLLKPVALLLFAEAAWSPAPLEGRDARHVRAVRDHLPYLPAAVATFTAFGYALSDQTVPAELMVLGTPLVALLVLRQLRALQELKRFSAELEARVVERTRALEAAQGLALRTERMNAVAVLSAGLAHDINNYLTTIRLAGNLIEASLQRGQAPNREDCESITAAVDRAAQLTRRLLQFGRDQGQAEVVDLVEAVTTMRPLLRVVPPPGVELSFRLDTGPLPIHARRSQLEQMVMNLVTNARDALRGPGRIALAVQRAAGPTGPEALVIVEDSGEGISPDDQARLFEPFFTTKGPEKGSGLGLVSVRKMVEQHQGQIELKSAPGVGTTFTLRFPLVTG